MSKDKKYNLIVIVLCFLFFWVYSYLALAAYWPQWSVFGHLIFNWPDESANYFFANLFADTGRFVWMENLNIVADNLVHARSVNVLAGGSLVPMTFLPALLIFGLLTKIFGNIGILFLTPALAALTVFFVYRLIFYIFKSLELALLVILLMLPLAPWAYFANMVMLPNILFIFLVVFGYFAITQSFVSEYKKDFWWILGSAVLTLAVFVRPTEIIWLAFLSLSIIYWYRHQLQPKRVVGGIFVLVIFGFIFLFFNKIVYGAYLASGYLNLQNQGLPTEFGSHSFWRVFLMPFGFDAQLVLHNFYKYFIKIMPLHFALALIGAAWIFFKSKVDLVWKKYLAISGIIFIIILLYYGSWQLADPLVRELNTISISYVRYFLPLYILALPFAAYAIIGLCRYLGVGGRFLKWLIIIVFGLSSFKIAFLTTHDGLISTKQNIDDYYEQFARVKKIAPQDSVIISERSDKVFWPYYKVVVSQGDLPLFPRIATFIEQVPVFYYTDLDQTELESIISKAQESGFYFGEPDIIDNNFKLYKINNLVK